MSVHTWCICGLRLWALCGLPLHYCQRWQGQRRESSSSSLLRLPTLHVHCPARRLQVLTQCFADPGGLYPARIAAQPELYGRIRRRLAEYNLQASFLGFAHCQASFVWPSLPLGF